MMIHAIRQALMILLLLLLGLLSSTNLSCAKTISQKYSLKHPESVVYDSVRDRYLISNVEGKNILAMDGNNVLALFADSLAGPKGLSIAGDTLFVADVSSVRAFSLKNGSELWNLSLPNALFLNDTAVDDTHYLYVSDSNASFIYRIDRTNRNIQVYSNKELVKPNGLFYDIPNKRLLLISQRSNSPIQALHWDTNKLETVMTTNLSSLDGLTCDDSGIYYITSWQSKGVYQITPSFNKQPSLIKNGFNGPADLCYDSSRNILLLPVMMEDRIEKIQVK